MSTGSSKNAGSNLPENRQAVSPARQEVETKTTGLGAISKLLDSRKQQIQETLGKTLSAARLIQIAKLQAFSIPELGMCDPLSVLSCVMRAATLGLDLDPSASEAYLIPRNNKVKGVLECTFQIGYQGLRKMVLRTGDVAAFETRLVFSHEVFEVTYIPKLNMIHKPIYDPAKRGTLIAGYGYGCMKGGYEFISYISMDEILYLKGRGKGKQPAWETDFEQMCRKTIAIRLAKEFPKSQDVTDCLRDEYDQNGPDFDRPAPAMLGAAGVKDRLGIAKPATPPHETIDAEYEQAQSASEEDDYEGLDQEKND